MSNLKPQISIIIPAYQHGNEIGRCLDSIFNQTFADFEIIVVNDGSTDNTLEALDKYEDKIKIINQENKGGNSARNRGFRESSGDFLFFCDADVVLAPEALEEMFKTLKQHPEFSYAYSSFKLGWKIFRCGEFDSDKLKKINYISTMSLIRREHFPYFDENIRRLQDWDLWLTMLQNGYTGVWIPKALFKAQPRKKYGLSMWFPKIFYKFPWLSKRMRDNIKDYKEAVGVIKKKHGL